MINNIKLMFKYLLFFYNKMYDIFINIMDNIIKNLIVTDSIAENNMTTIDSIIQRNVLYGIKSYYYLTPWIIMSASVNENIFETNIKPTIHLLMLFNLLDIINKHKNQVTLDVLILFIDDVFKNINFDNYNNYHDIKTYEQYVIDINSINKQENDIFLMEISIVISIVESDYENMLNLSSQFIKKITNNGIKILSFISLSILMYYAKKYYLNKNNSDPEKWLDMLLDQFLNSTIDKYINDIQYTDKKKFTLMLINYKSHMPDKNDDEYIPLSHVRIEHLENIFCDKIDEKNNYIPGSTADQLLLISYDFFINAKNWYGSLTSNCLSFCQTRCVNLFGSIFYYFVNKNVVMFNKFDKIKLDNDIIVTIKLFESFINRAI